MTNLTNVSYTAHGLPFQPHMVLMVARPWNDDLTATIPWQHRYLINGNTTSMPGQFSNNFLNNPDGAWMTPFKFNENYVANNGFGGGSQYAGWWFGCNEANFLVWNAVQSKLQIAFVALEIF